MASQLSFKLGSSMREWIILRSRSDNPYSALDGPLLMPCFAAVEM